MRYLLNRPRFTLSVRRKGGKNRWEFYVDSDLGGDTQATTRSRTGIALMLNGMPLHWVSRKQPQTAFSSAAAEVFAFSEAVKEVRLLLWRAEDMGTVVKYPFKLLEDNAATVSFQGPTTPYSKLRGVYNLREAWVREMNAVMAEKVPTDLNAADLFTKCHEWASMRKYQNNGM